MARSLEQWLDEYNASHQNPTNKKIHFACVPAIAVCTVALLWLLPIPGTPLNAGMVLVALSALFYLRLSVKLALGMLPFVAAVVAGIFAYQAHISLPLWIPAAAIWIVAWYFQFVGHKAESVKPSFFTDILFLLIGPLWILAFGYDKLGIRYR